MFIRTLTLGGLMALSAALAGPAHADPEASGTAYLSGSTQTTYLAKKKKGLGINARTFDPFGLSQDGITIYKPPVPDTPEEPTIEFHALMEKLSIATIDLDTNSFLPRGGSFLKEGDRFVIEHKGRQIEVQVNEVKKDRVSLTEVATNSQVVISFENDLPPGVIPAGSGQSVPLPLLDSNKPLVLP